MVKRVILRVCNAIIRRLSNENNSSINERKNSMEDALAHVKKYGFEPVTVIDVGAADGTPSLYDTFPDAYHFALEPLQENEAALEKWKNKYRLDYVITAAGSTEGKIKFNVHTDHLAGSSLLKEQTPEFDGVEREVPIQTLDKLCKDRNLKGPFLLKIDTQGSELEVLKGASEVLKDTEYIVLEMSFFEFYKGQPIIEDIIIFLKEKGFTLYDIGEIFYRPLDNACGQTDMAFVKRNGRFRTSNEYASLKQWNNR